MQSGCIAWHRDGLNPPAAVQDATAAYLALKMTRDVANPTDVLATVAELVNHAVRRVQRGAEIQPRLLDVDDSARYLGMSDKGVRELIVQGELPYIQKVPGRSPYLIDIKDLDRWIDGNKVRP